MRSILAILALVGVAACGTKGPLSLPPGAAPVPLLGNSAPPPPKPANAVTGSKDQAAGKEGSTPAKEPQADVSTRKDKP